MEPPQESRPGCNLNRTVHAEGQERHRSGDQPGHNRDHTFEAVIADGEVFEPLASANKIRTNQANAIHFITRIVLLPMYGECNVGLIPTLSRALRAGSRLNNASSNAIAHAQHHSPDMPNIWNFHNEGWKPGARAL